MHPGRSEYPQALSAAAEVWGVRLEGPPRHSIHGCVAFGRLGDKEVERGNNVRGRLVVVKLTAPASDEMRGWAALRHYRGRGAVRLLAHTGPVSLLERVTPGDDLSTLVRAGRDDEATVRLSDVAAALHQEPPGAESMAIGFPTLMDLARGFDRYVRAGVSVLPTALVDRAARHFDDLVASQDAVRLLHGDLHHFNILRDDDRGWVAIDPKGVLGEPAYEFGAALRNPAGEGFDFTTFGQPAAIDRRTRIIAERSGVDRPRLLEWGFAQAALSAIWSWEDRESPALTIALARTMEGML